MRQKDQGSRENLIFAKIFSAQPLQDSPASLKPWIFSMTATSLALSQFMHFSYTFEILSREVRVYQIVCIIFFGFFMNFDQFLFQVLLMGGTFMRQNLKDLSSMLVGQQILGYWMSIWKKEMYEVSFSIYISQFLTIISSKAIPSLMFMINFLRRIYFIVRERVFSTYMLSIISFSQNSEDQSMTFRIYSTLLAQMIDDLSSIFESACEQLFQSG